MPNPTVNALLQIAWADGQIEPSEKQLLLTMMGRLGLSPSEAQAALEQPPHEVDLKALALTLPAKEDRLNLMKLLMEVSFADDILTVDEYLILERAEQALGITEEEAEQLRQQLT